MSKHFSDNDWACKCGCGLNRMAKEQEVIAEIIRHFEGGKPLKPNSGCRCIEHNEYIQGKYKANYKPYSSKSMHLPRLTDGTIDNSGVSCAVDYPSDKPMVLYAYLIKLFPRSIYGLGLYSWGVHVDVRDKGIRW